jgi:hypothetical protein
LRAFVFATLLVATLSAACADSETYLPPEVAGVVVDALTGKPISWVRVSVELKRDSLSGFGHTVRGSTTLVVAETKEDGRFVVDLGEYRDSQGRDKLGARMRLIMFEKDRYETVVKLRSEDWSRTEMKPVPPK